MLLNRRIVAPHESSEVYSVQVCKAGGEHGPAVSIYWNDHLNEFCELYYYVVILRSPSRTVLINSGLPPDVSAFDQFVKSWHPACHITRDESETTQHILAANNVDTASVETVILTPLTIYTTGNLSRFPNARFAVSRRGWVDFWAPIPHAPRLPVDVAICRESRLFLAGEALDRMILLDDEDEICPGIRCFWTGGHHMSSMAIRIATSKGTVIVGDCFFTYENLEKNIPIGWAENLHEIYAAYDRVRREADIVVPLYDPEVLKRFPGGLVA